MQQKSKFNSSVALDPSSDCQFAWSSNISWEVWQSLFITADTLPCVKFPYVWSVCFLFFFSLFVCVHWWVSCIINHLSHLLKVFCQEFFWSILFDNKGMFYAEEEACVDRKKKKKTFQDCGNSCCWLPLSQGWYSCVVSHQSRTSPLHLCPL